MVYLSSVPVLKLTIESSTAEPAAVSHRGQEMRVHLECHLGHICKRCWQSTNSLKEQHLTCD